MALSVPETPKTKTKIYENFKGVDYTNDSTNVWYRRSPSGVNMLPDASGRPFKRKGWESVISADDLLAKFVEEEIEIEETSIQRCFYFELAGIDHIIIFSIGGVFKYANDTLSFLEGSDDVDCYASYDRAFFFEGDGKSAFYIYGNYKVWMYGYKDGEFSFAQVTYKYPEDDECGIEIPTVMIGTEADGTGTVHYGYNLLGNLASVEYQGNALWYHYCSKNLAISVDKTTFKTTYSQSGIYTFQYNGTNWEYNSTTVSLETIGINILSGTAQNGNKIVVLNDVFGVVLPNNVVQADVSKCKCYVTTETKFDTPIDVVAEQSGGQPVSPTDSTCVLHTDNIRGENAWIQFNADHSTTDKEDKIKAIFPVTEVTITTYTDTVGGGSASVVKRGDL